MAARVYPVLTGVIAWLAVGLQFYITTPRSLSAGKTLIGTCIYLLSFFTILTNMLVAISLTVPLKSRAAAFFSKPGVRTALLVYIAMVALSYNLLLRHLWSPRGVEWVADELFHDVVPVMYLLFWIFLVPKGTLRFGQILKWMLYPTAYVVFVLVRGRMLGQYPYPFLDAGALGYARVLLNILGLLGGFLLMGAGAVAVDRAMGRGARH